MGGIVEGIFGGQDDSAQDATIDQNRRSFNYTKEMADQARTDALAIYPGATQNLHEGFRAATDVARRTPLAQLRQLQGTNVQAQGSLLGGMNAYNNHIMGTPTGLQSDVRNNPWGMRPVTAGQNERAGEPFWMSERLDFLGERPGAGAVEPDPANLPAPDYGVSPNPTAAPNAQQQAINWSGLLSGQQMF